MAAFHALFRRRRALAALALAGALLCMVATGANPSQPRAIAADGPLTVSISVQPFGTRAAVKVTTSLPTVLHSAAAPVGSAPPPMSAVDGGGTSGGIHPGFVLSPSSYVTTHEYTVADLTDNTTYTLTVQGATLDGQTTGASVNFTTLKQRVRVTLREIDITDDGDFIGDGEPLWVIGVNYKRGDGSGTGMVGACYPVPPGGDGICQAGSFGEGRLFPRASDGRFLSWTFAQENFDQFPNMFDINVDAMEEDFIPIVGAIADFFQECNPISGCGFSASPATDWQAPQGVEWASQAVTIKGDDLGGGLHSTLIFTYEMFHDNLSYPSARNTPSSTWR
jgi:hypothetical protein